MTQFIKLGMVVVVLLAGGLLVACGDDNKDDDSPTATAGATESNGETPTDGETPTEEDGGSSGSFDDVPLPDGAEEQASGSYTSDQVPFPVADFDAGVFSNLAWRSYSVDSDAESVLAFYESELSDWNEVFKSDVAGAGAFGLWTRNDNSEALWVGFTDIGDGTQLLVIHGTAN